MVAYWIVGKMGLEVDDGRVNGPSKAEQSDNYKSPFYFFISEMRSLMMAMTLRPRARAMSWASATILAACSSSSPRGEPVFLISHTASSKTAWPIFLPAV